MNAHGRWLGRLFVSGTCLILAGCGGSDVPDPDSDSNAVRDQPVPVIARAPEAPAAAEPAAPAAPAETAPAATATAPSPAAPAEASAATTPPAGTEAAAASEGEAPAAPVVKADSSATDELARLAAEPPPAVEAAPATAAGGPAGSGTSMAPGGLAALGGPGGPGMVASEGGSGPGTSPPPGDPIGAMGAGPALGGGGIPGAPGAEGSLNAGNDNSGIGTNEPADFTMPATGAAAFLSALKAKDKDRLVQAVARRAPTEASEKHRKTFAAISDLSISEEELDSLAKALDGYRLINQLPAVSSGRIDVVIGKMEGRDYHQRKLTMRHEKEGWKVLDVSNFLEFKQNRGISSGRRR